LNNIKVLSILIKLVDTKVRNKKEKKNSEYYILEVLKNKYHEEEFNNNAKTLQKIRKYEGQKW
jgi:hypothetical protein